ncbi:hypothetical protein DH2020_048175 [Rehmannia glutinosa]|uniref:Cytochrome P450 protein n=1 Tax=Rehmannia glutinosa TaxID=99300 RepID=A0ABR0U6D9_REHGL
MTLVHLNDTLNVRILSVWYTELLSESETQTIVVHRLGAPRTIVTANPENVEYILKTNFANFPKGKPFTELLGDFLGLGIFNVDGDTWSTQRKLASHEFSARSLRDVSRDGPFLFGLSRPPPPLAAAFDAASEMSAMRGTAPIPAVWKLKKVLNVGSEKDLKDAVGLVRGHVDEIIRSKKKKINGGDLLSRFLESGVGDEMVRDMVISFLMAGRDTTSAAVTWLLWLLTSHRGIENRSVEEVLSIQNGRLGYDDLKGMNFVKACLCESMRLYPPVVWDSKHAANDDVLPDGTRVYRGNRVTYFQYGMGRMEKLWGEDRMEFRPDRWFDENGAMKMVSPYKFPVFQAGPRVCLGKEMAFIQMKYVVASVLSRFEFKPVRKEQPVFVPLLTAYMAGGFNVRVRRRGQQ